MEAPSAFTSAPNYLTPLQQGELSQTYPLFADQLSHGPLTTATQRDTILERTRRVVELGSPGVVWSEDAEKTIKEAKRALNDMKEIKEGTEGGRFDEEETYIISSLADALILILNRLRRSHQAQEVHAAKTFLVPRASGQSNSSHSNCRSSGNKPANPCLSKSYI